MMFARLIYWLVLFGRVGIIVARSMLVIHIHMDDEEAFPVQTFSCYLNFKDFFPLNFVDPCFIYAINV